MNDRIPVEQSSVLIINTCQSYWHLPRYFSFIPRVHLYQAFHRLYCESISLILSCSWSEGTLLNIKFIVKRELTRGTFCHCRDARKLWSLAYVQYILFPHHFAPALFVQKLIRQILCTPYKDRQWLQNALRVAFYYGSANKISWHKFLRKLFFLN